MRLVVLSDTHYAPAMDEALGARHCGWADALLQRAVHRLNRMVRPDVVVVLGDVLNDGTDDQAEGAFREVKRILDGLSMPWLIIPGNHDGPAETFYRHFPRPPAHVDIAGVRLLCFVDAEEPGYNARRTADDVARLRSARTGGWRGHVIALQHVPVFAPGSHPCPYNYVNATDILQAMQDAGVTAAVSGHYHAGIDLLQGEACATVVAPALCESPFSYLVLDIEGTQLRVQRQQLALPMAGELVDSHCHTHLAYCNENMEIGRSQCLANAFGLKGICITEHSGHLYFPQNTYGPICCADGISSAQPQYERLDSYKGALEQGKVPPAYRGIEIDCDFQGNALARMDDLKDLPFRLGAMHYLPGVHDPNCTDTQAGAIFLGLLTRFLTRHDFHSLAHPFRVFRRCQRPIPHGLFEPVVAILRRTHTAAEINFHTNEPPQAFLRLCLNAGVRFSLGSDAHNLHEVGEFFPHLEALWHLGVTESNLADVLLPL